MCHTANYLLSFSSFNNNIRCIEIAFVDDKEVIQTV